MVENQESPPAPASVRDNIYTLEEITSIECPWVDHLQVFVQVSEIHLEQAHLRLQKQLVLRARHDPA